MHLRRSSRILAFRVISQRETIGPSVEGEAYLFHSAGLHSKYEKYALSLINACEAHKSETLQRIYNDPKSKKHFLQQVQLLCLISATELLYFTETPPKAVINEWVEICKTYVGASHFIYCNGVLNRILHTVRSAD